MIKPSAKANLFAFCRGGVFKVQPNIRIGPGARANLAEVWAIGDNALYRTLSLVDIQIDVSDSVDDALAFAPGTGQSCKFLCQVGRLDQDVSIFHCSLPPRCTRSI